MPVRGRRNIYVQSERAGQRVMEGMRQLYGKLRLKVNESKSRVAPATGDGKFLGYGFWRNRKGEVKRAVAKKALETMKERVRKITKRPGGKSMRQVFDELSVYLRGWKNFFRLAETPWTLRGLDGWIRRRLRMVQVKQWRTGKTARQRLTALRVPPYQAQVVAALARRYWRAAKHPALYIAFPNSYYDRMGVPRLAT